MIGMIDPAWKDEVVERAAAAFEPCQNTGASGFEELELNGSAGLLLNDDRASTNPATADEIADLDFNDVASPGEFRRPSHFHAARKNASKTQINAE